MSDYDLLQTGARIRRLISSLVAGIVVAGIAAPVLWKIIDPPSGVTLGPWKAFVSFLLLAGAVAFTITHYFLKKRDDKSWHVPAPAIVKSAPTESKPSQ